MTKIILLDVDGVLVRPGGYRAALRATLHRFWNAHFEVDEKTLEDLERRGITSEWDMAPLLLASYWTSILERQPMPDLPADVSSAAAVINLQRRVDAPARLSIPEFPLTPGQYPAESAFRAGCFPSIPAELRKNLLTQTRNIHASATMRVFQHFTLGSQKFTETYRLPAEFETESFLLAYDIPNIDAQTRSQLFRAGMYPVAFTARPSRPPREASVSPPGYPPEAELALDLVGLPEIPLLAFGKLEYLAAGRQLQPETLLKPAPFHALAAALAAWTGEELSALQAAAEWLESGALNGHFRALPASFELIVIEDTLSGVRSAQAAGKILQAAGFDIAVRALGLTSGSASRAAMFERVNTPHYADWSGLVNALTR
jgi:beta-phosphoglucomutase-like phosphatase (HAD superfamily)